MKRDRSEREFQNLFRRLELALDASQIGVWEHDIDSDRVVWDQRMLRIYGMEDQGPSAAATGWRNAIHPDDKARAEAEFAEAVERKGAYSSEYRIMLPDGSVRHIRSKAHFHDKDGPATFYGAEWDITDDILRDRELSRQKNIAETRGIALQATSAQVEYVARHDYLTGLPNRRFFDLKLTEMCQDDSVETLAILQIDIDRFKHINDTAGHSAGDAVLKATARMLASVQTADSFLARIAGDEFAILISNFTSAIDLQLIAEKILLLLQQGVRYEDELLVAGASIGIAWTNGRDGSNLLAEAGVALHRAKHLGRNRIELFSATMKAEIGRERRLAKRFTRALKRGEIVPFYQMQVDARSRRIIGLEVLARWRHPKKGWILPGEFLKIAEDLGLLAELDTCVLQAALLEREAWERKGVIVPRLAVNVSGPRLADPSLVREVQRLKIPRDSVSFELLETIFLDEVEDGMLSNIQGLKNLGIDIEIDDFGSGHASIIGLVKLKPRRLKIDRRLVIPITTSPEQVRLVRSIVEIAKALSIEVIAEGVETAEHAKILTRLGCDILQGYAIAYPVTGTEMLELLKSIDDGPAVANG